MPTALDPKLFQLMADQVRDYAIFLLDVDGNVLSWNSGATFIKQYHSAEIIGRHFSTFYTPADIDRKWPEFELKRALLDGRFEDEGWRLRKDVAAPSGPTWSSAPCANGPGQHLRRSPRSPAT